MVVSSSSLQGPSLGLSVMLSLLEDLWTDLLVPSGPESWEKSLLTRSILNPPESLSCRLPQLARAYRVQLRLSSRGRQAFLKGALGPPFYLLSPYLYRHPR